MGKGRYAIVAKRKWRSSVLAVSSHVCGLTCYHTLHSTLHKQITSTVSQVKGCSELPCCVVREATLPSLSSSLAIRKLPNNTDTLQLARSYSMAQQQDLTIERIRAYSKDAHEQCDDPMELDAHSTEARLAQTVRELQARVEEQQTALETVRSIRAVERHLLTHSIAPCTITCRH